MKMLYNRCTGIYKFGNNSYPRRIRRRSNLGHIFRGEKVCLMGLEIRYYFWEMRKNINFRKCNAKVTDQEMF